MTRKLKVRIRRWRLWCLKWKTFDQSSMMFREQALGVWRIVVRGQRADAGDG
jgi:hypothetical protein